MPFFEFKKNEIRTDNKEEVSINWLDDSRAIEIALNQKNAKGEKQFKAGVVKLELKKVKDVLLNIPTKNIVEFERNELEDNKYHGNILIDASTPK